MSRVGSAAFVLALGLSLLGTTSAASADDEPGVELRSYDLSDLAAAWSSNESDDADDVPRASEAETVSPFP